MSSALAKRIKHGRYVNDGDQRPLDEEFITVGYSCTLFRDDEKADFMNEQRHLIAHPSDESVTMDRYDARLHLHDLDLHDAARVERSGGAQQDTKRNNGDADETELEFERYRDLMAADDEEESNIGSVASPAVESPSDASTCSRTSSPFVEESKDARKRRKEEPFVAPPELEVPPGIQLPKTKQAHAIIAKTAVFVATKGPQMEIVIKAKQRTKEHHFEFLNFDNILRPYYDHVLNMIKKGRYHFVEEPEESDDDDEGGDYLHPSLRASASAGTSKVQAKKPDTSNQEQTAEEAPIVDLQPIMDRLAEYVARNGDAFEDVVRSRKDPLYGFIEPKHEYNAYYRQRVHHYRTELGKMVISKAVEQVRQRAATASPNPGSSSRWDKKERVLPKRQSTPSLVTASVKSGSGSRSNSGDDKKSSSRDQKKSGKRRAPSPSTDEEDDSDDEGENQRQTPGIEFATFVPLPSSDVNSRNSSPIRDSDVKRSLGVDDEEKGKTDDTVKDMQEKRRAKAKIFLRLIRDRDQKASKVVKTDKPWDDD